VRYYWLVCLLLLGSAVAQSIHTASSTPQQKSVVRDDDDDDDDDAGSTAPVLASTLPAKTPVITIKGICEKTQTAQSTTRESSPEPVCSMTVSRQDFDELVDGMQPGMSATKIEQLADSYAKFLVMQHEASKFGLDKGERFRELMKFARAQILTKELDRYLQQEAGNISDQEVSAYYKANPLFSTRATFQRLFIPHSRHPSASGESLGAPDNDPSALHDPMKATADALREKAVAGEEFDKLETEAFAAAGLKGSAPTSMGAVRPPNLPAGHSAVFKMKLGEVSKVISDSTGFYVYKIVTKEQLPLADVKEDISTILKARRMEEFSRRIQAASKIELNEAYFAPNKDQPDKGADTSSPPARQEPEQTLNAERRR
jgi:hypothetical protein